MENKEVPTELNQISIPVCIVIALVCAVISAAIAFFAGVAHRKKTAEFAIHSAEDEAKRIVSEAIKPQKQRKRKLFWKARMKSIANVQKLKRN